MKQSIDPHVMISDAEISINISGGGNPSSFNWSWLNVPELLILYILNGRITYFIEILDS